MVLAVFLGTLAVGFTIPPKFFHHQETSQFLNRLELDVLYLQELNMYEAIPAYMTINPDSNQYIIRKSGTGAIVVKRNFPPDWKIHLRTLAQPISYTRNGTIKSPGSFLIVTEQEQYKVVFPFGKGRVYFEKQ